MQRAILWSLFVCLLFEGPSNAAILDATWDVNGNGNWSSASNWDIGVVPNNTAADQYNVHIDSDVNFDVVVTLNITSTINNLAVDEGDELSFVNNIDLGMAGSSIVNDGTISLNSTGSLTDWIMRAPVTTLSGTGRVQLVGNVNNRVFGLVETNELVNSSTHTISGAGQLGAGFLKVTNQGVIDANDPLVLLTIDPSNSGTTNTGTLQASGGGTLRLQGGTFDGTGGGTIHAADGSIVELGADGRIAGGTITTEGSGRIKTPNNLDPIIAGDISNNGQWEMNSTGSLTDTRVDVAATLMGSGTLTLVGNINNRIYGLTADAVLTNENGHTIAGQGQLGTNFMGLVNNGVVNANDATGDLLIVDPSASGVANTGTLQASGGGRLRLQGGTFDSSGGGVIHAADGSFVELGTDGRILGGTLTTEGTGRIQTPNELDPIVAGTITNNGKWEMNSTGTLTNMRVDVAATLTGSGTLTLVGSFNNRIYGLTADAVLTNASGHTIAGQGQLGTNFMGLVNDGLIDGNDATSAALIIDPSSAGVTNSGQFQASGGGRLRLQGGTFNNTGGGTIHAEDGSFVELGTDGRVVGGTLSTVGSGRIQVPNNFDPIIAGTITNNGQWEMNSTGSLTDMRVDESATLTGSGTLTLIGSQSNRIYGLANTAVLTNSVSHTIAGQGQLGTNFMDLVNEGLIDANYSIGVLTIDPTANVVNQSTGILRGSGAAGLQLTGGTFDNQGTIEALNGSNVTYSTTAVTANNMSGVLTGGIWRSVSTDSAATVTLRGNSITQIAADTEVELSGVSSALQVATTTLESTLSANAGTLRILNARAFNLSSAFNNTGTIEVGGAGLAGATLSGNVTNAASGVIAGHGQIDGTLINEGSLDGDSATDFLELNGTVSGGGAMKDVRIDGTHIVGSDGGTAIVPLEGSYRLNGDAVHLQMDIGGLTPGIEHDQLNSAGNFTLGGSLDVSLINGFSPALDDTFEILTAVGGVSGTFDTQPEELPALPSGLEWAINYGVNNVVLQIVAPDLLGDYNEDGTINAADYTVYRNRKAGIGGTTLPNDAGAAGVTIDDYNYWKAHYGEMAGSGAGANFAAEIVVPEPLGLPLLIIAIILSAVSRRVRPRRCNLLLHFSRRFAEVRAPATRVLIGEVLWTCIT